MNKILVVDDVISKEECLEAIHFFNKYGYENQWRDTFVRNITNALETKHIIKKIVDVAKKNFIQNFDIGWGEIVLWPPGSYQPDHLDTADKNTVLTSITYLNEDYIGGKTILKETATIIPKIGRTVFFNGMHFVHSVEQINFGNRYTIPIWYNLNASSNS